jgi:phospholipid/cholesterol/gamma-HCH transport system substrate-binding protein
METRSNHVLVGGITLALLIGLVAFLVWLAGLGGGATKDFDIFFKQSVEGLNRGSAVSFSGVPAGEVKEIELWKANPEFVRVRISIKDTIPILFGTTAAIQQTSFTGPNQIQLSGAVKGAPEISEAGPAGVPVIPTRTGGLGALLNNAPQLVERLSTLTDRLTEVLSDKNQKSFAGILSNVDNLTGELAKGGPDMRATIAETRLAVRQAGQAADQIAKLAGTTDALVNTDGKAMLSELQLTAKQAQKSIANLDAAIGDVRPGLQAISTQTVPEIGQLVRDLRTMSDALGSVATKLDQGGATSILGPPALPDYKPGRNGK